MQMSLKEHIDQLASETEAVPDTQERCKVFEDRANRALEDGWTTKYALIAKSNGLLERAENLMRAHHDVPLQPFDKGVEIEVVRAQGFIRGARLLQSMRVLVQRFGGKFCLPYEGILPDAAPPIVEVKPEWMKNMIRAREKVDNYGGDARRLVDWVRASGLMTLDKMALMFDESNFTQANFRIIRVKNGLQNQVTKGFPFVQFCLEYVGDEEKAFICELQIQVLEFREAWDAKHCHSMRFKRARDEAERETQSAMVKCELDNPEARGRIVAIQQEISQLEAACMRNRPRTRLEDIEARVSRLLKEAIEIVNAEIERIGKLNAKSTEYYSLVTQRWETMRKIELRETSLLAVQPLGWGGRAAEARVFRGTKATRPIRLARDHAREMLPHFKRSLERLVDQLNEAASIEALRLDWVALGLDSMKLPFDDGRLVDGKRAALTFGPLKRMDRVQEKVEEYDEEIDEGKKAHDTGGRRLMGVDYVLDWLRATVSAEDPYVLFVMFLILISSPDTFEIQRVKNKIFDDKFPPYIRTNALINLLLLYPKDATAFAASGLRGEFEPACAGMRVASVEVQLTLHDFLTIKELLHTYYDIERAPDPMSYLLENPIFVDLNTFEPVVPAVVREIEERRAKQAAAEPLQREGTANAPTTAIAAGSSRVAANLAKSIERDAEINPQ